jgi:hypothetical protein
LPQKNGTKTIVMLTELFTKSRINKLNTFAVKIYVLINHLNYHDISVNLHIVGVEQALMQAVIVINKQQKQVAILGIALLTYLQNVSLTIRA